MSGAVVLFSAGLDSTINFYEAIEDVGVCLALFVNYGQRAANKEWEYARVQADNLSVAIKKVDLEFLGQLGGSSLTDHKKEVVTNVDIDNFDASKESAKNVWVPNRNGVLLNLAGAFAESLGAKYVVPGFNLEEAQTFPDNSEDFLEAMTSSLKYSTANQVEVKCYTTKKNKVEIYKRGIELEVDFENVWSCYLGMETMCGQCESCQRYFRAKEEAEAQ